MASLFSYRDEPQCGSHLGAGHPQHVVNWAAARDPYHSEEKASADGKVSSLLWIFYPRALKYFNLYYRSAFADLSHVVGL